MPLDEAAAHAACARLGEQVAMDAYETAWGIREVALVQMVKAVRGRLAARGLDPRAFSILNYGGCGALFTPEIALAIHCPKVLIPEFGSVLSALGAATANVRRERVRGVFSRMPAEPESVDRICVELGARVNQDLAADGIRGSARTLTFEAELHFRRQQFELPVTLRRLPVDDGTIVQLMEAFRTEYERRYGQGSMVRESPIELVALRAVGVGLTPQASLESLRPHQFSGTPAAPSGFRTVQLERHPDGRVAVDTYISTDLQTGDSLKGPALIDSVDTTVWVPEGASATLDGTGTLVMEVGL
jgi:N-methylhydantoinase A